jgi:hypothetical protein
MPNLLYIAVAKSGNPAPNKLRTTPLDAIALFATGRYTSMIYVKHCIHTRNIPIPMNALAKTLAAQWILGLLVQANQKRPIGRRQPPRIIRGRRYSGLTTPFFSRVKRAKRVRVKIMVMVVPIDTPMRRPMMGREEIPSFHLRDWWKIIG